MAVYNKIESYHVIYTVPGESDRSAMPIGNGRIAASVWMTGENKLLFYIAGSDCLTELDRTVKYGLVEVYCPGFIGEDFKQELSLAEGIIRITSGKNTLEIFIEKDADHVLVKGRFDREKSVCAIFHNWRTAPKIPAGSIAYSAGITESADHNEFYNNMLLSYHNNGTVNYISYLAELEGLGHCVDVIPDAITNRIFGMAMSMKDGQRAGENTVVSAYPGCEFELRVSTLSIQTPSVQGWKEDVLSRHCSGTPYEEAKRKTAQYWRAYWEKSYVYVQGDQKRVPSVTEELRNLKLETDECNDFPSRVTAAYVHTRFMTACCFDGEFPVCYNGMLFNLSPVNDGDFLNVLTFMASHTQQPPWPTIDTNPDERTWCVENLWQNVRHPYLSMLMRGEYEPLKKMFAYYRRFWALNKERASVYYHAQGQHNTEMTLSSGLLSEGIYGKEREGLEPGYSVNRYGGAVDISPGLELALLELDYFAYTGDALFLTNNTLPFIKDLFLYIATRFSQRKNGKIVLQPLQSVETYFDTKNPTPVVAGLIAITQRILVLDIEDGDRRFFTDYSEILPELPTKKVGETVVVDVAEEYEDVRKNVESPELYAVYPFGLNDHPQWAAKLWDDTFQLAAKRNGFMRPYVLGEKTGMPSYSGWQSIGCVAAILGRREDCREIIENNASLKNIGNRFPAMWGPVYDAVPDTDHGANILNQLQLMMMRVVITGNSSKMHILPALPLDWDVSFKLYAPQSTSVQVEYAGGKLMNITVVPESRKDDIVLAY